MLSYSALDFELAGNPIYQRLSRAVPVNTLRQWLIAAVIAAPVYGMFIAGWLIQADIVYATVTLFSALAAIACAVLPVTLAVMTASMTYQDTRGENYEFIRLTPLSGAQIMEGYYHAAFRRFAALRRIGIALTPASLVGFIVLNLIFDRAPRQILGAPAPALELEDYLFIFLMLAVLATLCALLIAVTTQFNKLGIEAGIGVAIRLRRQSYPLIALVAALPVAAIALVAATASVILIASQGYLWLWPCLPVYMIGLLLPLAGRKIIRNRFIASIDRAR